MERIAVDYGRHLAQIEERGFTVMERVVPLDFVERLRRGLFELGARERESGRAWVYFDGTSQRLFNLMNKDTSAIDAWRAALIPHFGRAYVRPQEDSIASVRKEVVDAAPPRIRQLLGYEVRGFVDGPPLDTPLRY